MEPQVVLAGDGVAGDPELVGGQQLRDGGHIVGHGLAQQHSRGRGRAAPPVQPRSPVCLIFVPKHDPDTAARPGAGHPGFVRRHIGALNPDDLNLNLAQALAHVVTIAILHQHREGTAKTLMPRLQAAVASRGVLEMVKGVLAEVHGLDMGTAFGRLRGYAREHNRHLSDVARRVAGAPEHREALLVDLASAMIAQPQPPSR